MEPYVFRTAFRYKIGLCGSLWGTSLYSNSITAGAEHGSVFLGIADSSRLTGIDPHKRTQFADPAPFVNLSGNDLKIAALRETAVRARRQETGDCFHIFLRPAAFLRSRESKLIRETFVFEEAEAKVGAGVGLKRRDLREPGGVEGVKDLMPVVPCMVFPCLIFPWLIFAWTKDHMRASCKDAS